MAETKTLYLGAYGGSTEKLMMEKILPVWEKANNAKVVYVPGNSTKTLAKLQAQKSNQELDVVFLDDGPMYKAISLGFCADIKDASIFNDVYDIAKMKTEKAVGLGFVVTGLAYDKQVFKAKGWDAPTSWADLADPKYKGKLVVPPVSNTYGLHALVMTARLNGGSETNIQPGFDQMIDKIASNVLVFEPSSGKLSELFQTKEVALASWGSGRMKSLSDTGFPGGFVYPKEGGVALMIATCPVVNSDVPELAQSLIQYLLTADVQKQIAEVKGWGPTNMKTVLPKELGDSIPYGPEKINALQTVDWTVINPVRAKWTKQWSRQVEK
ncbi:polyamine ABC transporter substrate-binding protein [Marinomonas sp. C1424]|uniref:Polyamine ABC transporter substrate-binding protein n=2 Tax=Marinomonas transparens TaxID=2795388 RepID=A0A934JUM1_9GAMM|nr:polyamine ABC transporter substrate-binding protein [Marinomonas transparens]